MSSLFSYPSSALTFILYSNVHLNVVFILSLSVLLTSVWYYYWQYAPGRPMRSRRVQNWWQLCGYVILFGIGSWRMYAEGLGNIFTRMQDVWEYPALTDRWSTLYFEVEIAWYCSR